MKTYNCNYKQKIAAKIFGTPNEKSLENLTHTGRNSDKPT